jgi:hypothetical protein
MKYALFEFVEDNSMYVGECACIVEPELNIDEFNNDGWDFDATGNNEVQVQWKGRQKKLFWAKIHRFSGTYRFCAFQLGFILLLIMLYSLHSASDIDWV